MLRVFCEHQMKAIAGRFGRLYVFRNKPSFNQSRKVCEEVIVLCGVGEFGNADALQHRLDFAVMSFDASLEEESLASLFDNLLVLAVSNNPRAAVTNQRDRLSFGSLVRVRNLDEDCCNPAAHLFAIDINLFRYDRSHLLKVWSKLFKLLIAQSLNRWFIDRERKRLAEMSLAHQPIKLSHSLCRRPRRVRLSAGFNTYARDE